MMDIGPFVEPRFIGGFRPREPTDKSGFYEGAVC